MNLFNKVVGVRLLGSGSAILVMFSLVAVVFIPLVNQQLIAREQSARSILVVEVLFIHKGILMLGCEILPTPQGESDLMRVMGFTADGKYVSPPDPGFLRQHVVEAQTRLPGDPKPKLPLAYTTHFWKAYVTSSGRLMIGVSDSVKTAPRPKKLGASEFTVLGGLFRIERVKKAPEPLRQDYDYLRQMRRQSEQMEEQLDGLSKLFTDKTFLQALVNADAREIQDMRKRIAELTDLQQQQTKQLRREWYQAHRRPQPALKPPTKKKLPRSDGKNSDTGPLDNADALMARQSKLGQKMSALGQQFAKAMGQKQPKQQPVSEGDALCRQVREQIRKMAIAQAFRRIELRNFTVRKNKDQLRQLVRSGISIEDSLRGLAKLLANKMLIQSLTNAKAREVSILQETLQEIINLQQEQTKQLHRHWQRAVK